MSVIDNQSETKLTAFHRIAAILLIFVAVTAVYYSTLDNPFVWDDSELITANTFIHNPHNIRNLFTREYFSQTIEISYRPVNTLTFFADYALWQNRTPGYHFINLLLHILNSLLFFSIAAAVIRRPWVSIAMSLIFALHPVMTEALNAVTFREDPLCLFFMMFSLVMYIKSSGGGAVGRALKILISFLSFFLALFTKETAVVFPILIFGYEYFVVEKQSAKRAMSLTALYVLPTLFYLYIRFGPMSGPGDAAPAQYHGGGPLANIIIMLQAWATYIAKSVWPANLCIDHEFPNDPVWTAPAFISALFLLVAGFMTAVLGTLRNRKAGFGALWFALMLLPVSNIIPIGVVMAERYLYPAIPGLLLFAGILLSDFFLEKQEKYPTLARNSLALMLIAAVIACAAATHARNKVWDSAAQFWGAACDCAPTSARNFVNYGVSLTAEGNNKEAETALVRAVRLSSPGDRDDIRYGVLYRAIENLGIIYAKENNPGRAVSLLMEAVRLNPKSPKPYWNLGAVFMNIGEPQRAESFFVKGLNIEPNDVQARLRLVAIYHALGKLDDSIAQCDKILEIDPGFVQIARVKDKLIAEKAQRPSEASGREK